MIPVCFLKNSQKYGTLSKFNVSAISVMLFSLCKSNFCAACIFLSARYAPKDLFVARRNSLQSVERFVRKRKASSSKVIFSVKLLSRYSIISLMVKVEVCVSSLFSKNSYFRMSSIKNNSIKLRNICSLP